MPLYASDVWEGFRKIQVRRPARSTWSNCPGTDMKRKNKIISLIITCMLSVGRIVAQGNLAATDTLVLNEVHVSAEGKSSRDKQILKLDEASGMLTFDMGQYLDRMGHLQILSNGAPGAASSVRSRGMSSDHSMLYWNGVPVNSFSLGSCDLSLIPVFFFDAAEVNESSSLSDQANSNLGSSIGFFTSRKPIQKFDIRVLSSLNTLNNSFTGIDVGIPVLKMQNSGKWNLWMRTRMFYQDIQNDFGYRDAFLFEHPYVIQQHNNGINRGMQQELRLYKGKSDFAAHVWLQGKSVELPEIMGSSGMSSAEQDDNVMRSQLAYRYFGNRIRYSATAALLQEELWYRDEQLKDGEWGVNSKIKSQLWYADAKMEMGIGKYFLMRNGLTWMMPEVRNTNYENRSQNISWGQLNSALMMRKEAHQFQLEGRYDSRMNVLKPNFTFDYSYRWHFHKLSLTPGVMLAEQWRYPDFNELFWIPGGNRDLEPEEGKMLEARLNVVFNLSKYFNFESGMKYVSRHVTNWIQWIPGIGGYWSPVNYKSVQTSGMEFPVKLYGSYRDIIWRLEGNYRFTEALFVNDQVWNSSEARYLSYTPKHTWHAGVEVGYREGFMRFRHNYYSERFTEESNLIYRSLPAYSLCYIEVGTAINLKQIVIKPSISVDNVFDVAYQSIRSYAMPGRVTQLNIQISYLQKNK